MIEDDDTFTTSPAGFGSVRFISAKLVPGAIEWNNNDMFLINKSSSENSIFQFEIFINTICTQTSAFSCDISQIICGFLFDHTNHSPVRAHY